MWERRAPLRPHGDELNTTHPPMRLIITEPNPMRCPNLAPSTHRMETFHPFPPLVGKWLGQRVYIGDITIISELNTLADIYGAVHGTWETTAEVLGGEKIMHFGFEILEG